MKVVKPPSSSWIRPQEMPATGCLLYTSPHPFAMICLSVVLAGAVGNLIDRAFLGYVTDMFQTCLLYTSRCV